MVLHEYEMLTFCISYAYLLNTVFHMNAKLKEILLESNHAKSSCNVHYNIHGRDEGSMYCVVGCSSTDLSLPSYHL